MRNVIRKEAEVSREDYEDMEQGKANILFRRVTCVDWQVHGGLQWSKMLDYLNYLY